MIYKGIFWLIEGELYTKKLECDKSQADLGGTAEKRNTWERVQLLSSWQSGDKGRQGCDIS